MSLGELTEPDEEFLPFRSPDRHPLGLEAERVVLINGLVSEPALGNDQHVTWFHFYIGRNVTAFYQVSDTNAVLSVVFRCAQNCGAIAISEISDAAYRYHDIQKRHFLLVGQNLRFGCCANDPNLFTVRANEACHNDGYDRVANVFAQFLFNVACKGG